MMKENKYDDQTFFTKYSEMTRSQKGLQGAGEWQTLKQMLPDFKKKQVLDLGCGYGWHCQYAVDHGAAAVLGTDISQRMLEEAKKRHPDPKITYQCVAMEEVTLPPASIDVVLSSLAFHYVATFETLIKSISVCLKPGGVLVFSVEHPVYTAEGSQDWQYDRQGEIQHFPVDHYYYEGKREAQFLGETVTKYHRTLTTYLMTLLQNGFILEKVIEPQPPEELLEVPGMKDEMRRPMMLLIAARKS